MEKTLLLKPLRPRNAEIFSRCLLPPPLFKQQQQAKHKNVRFDEENVEKRTKYSFQVD